MPLKELAEVHTRKHLGVFDVIGPAMIGPSSSHTAGAARLAGLARRLLRGELVSARFTLYGSLAATYRGHGTDLALIAGSLGLSPDDEHLPRAAELAKAQGTRIEFIIPPQMEGLIHPNLVRMELESARESVDVLGASLGGGEVEINEFNGFPVSLRGDEYTLVINSRDRVGVITRISSILSQVGANIGNMAVSRLARGDMVVMCIELDEGLAEPVLARLAKLPGVAKLTALDRI